MIGRRRDRFGRAADGPPSIPRMRSDGRPQEPTRPDDGREPREPRRDGRAWWPISARRQAEVAGRGAGGDDRSIDRHRERGKLPVRERIDRLIDPGSAFLELSPLAANGLYDDDAPSAGIVTGIGRIEGTLCRRRRQRRHREGRHVLPGHREEAPPRAGDRPTRTGCHASTSSIRVARSCRSRRTSSPTGNTSGASSTTRRACRPRAFRRSRS